MTQVFEFEIELIEPAPVALADFESIANRLYEAGCDDGTVSSCNRRITIGFGREADTIGQAIDTAMTDIRKAGQANGE